MSPSAIRDSPVVTSKGVDCTTEDGSLFRLTAVGTKVAASFLKSRSSGAASIVAAAILAALVGFGGSDG